MGDGDSKRPKNKIAQGQSSDLEHDGSPVPQSSRIRRGTVLANWSDWKSMVRQFHYVLYGGIILWLIYVISMAI